MRLIICGCKKENMEYLLDALGLIARRDRMHLTVTAPDSYERNDDLCRYITIDEDIHTDIGKGMADVLVVYRYSAGIRRIENLKNSGKLVLIKESGDMGDAFYSPPTGPEVRSPSAKKDAEYLHDLLYLKNDAIFIEKSRKVADLFGYYVEEEILKLLGLR